VDRRKGKIDGHVTDTSACGASGDDMVKTVKAAWDKISGCSDRSERLGGGGTERRG
jgi:hypothetical protein